MEIRVVVHRLTYRRLHDLATLIIRNLSFAERVAVMGLETVGYTRPNMDAVWIDPVEYQQEFRTRSRTWTGGNGRVDLQSSAVRFTTRIVEVLAAFDLGLEEHLHA